MQSYCFSLYLRVAPETNHCVLGHVLAKVAWGVCSEGRRRRLEVVGLQAAGLTAGLVCCGALSRAANRHCHVSQVVVAAVVLGGDVLSGESSSCTVSDEGRIKIVSWGCHLISIVLCIGAVWQAHCE